MRTFILLLIVIPFVISCDDDNPSAHNRDNEWASVVLSTSDGGYLAAGSRNFNTNTTDTLLSDIYLVHLDGEGNQLWGNTFDTPAFSYADAIRETSDGGFYLLGHSTGFSDVVALFTLRINASGFEDWQREIPLGGIFFVNDAVTTFDGGFLLLGRSEDIVNNISLVKIGTEGDVAWQISYYDGTMPFGVAEMPSGGYAVFTASQGVSDSVHLRPITAEGDTLPPRSAATQGVMRAVRSAPSGTFVFEGPRTTGPSTWHLVFMQSDEDLSVLWETSYDELSGAYVADFAVTDDGGIIAAGPFSNADNCFLARIDSVAVTWLQTFGANRSRLFNAVTTAHGSGYVAAGYAEAYDNANDVDMYVVKTDPSGNLIWEHTYGR